MGPPTASKWVGNHSLVMQLKWVCLAVWLISPNWPIHFSHLVPHLEVGSYGATSPKVWTQRWNPSIRDHQMLHTALYELYTIIYMNLGGVNPSPLLKYIYIPTISHSISIQSLIPWHWLVNRIYMAIKTATRPGRQGLVNVPCPHCTPPNYWGYFISNTYLFWWCETNPQKGTLTNPCNVVKTIINHPFGNDVYHLFMVMTGGWFITVLTIDLGLKQQ